MPRRPSTKKFRAPRAQRKKRTYKSKKMDNLEVVRQTFHLSSAVTPSQGVSVSNYVYWQISPSPYLSAANGVAVSLQSSPEFALYKNMYDQFRVHSVTLSVKPRANMTEAVGLVHGIDTSLITLGKNVFYSVEDRDGAAPASIAALKKYSSVKTHRCDKSMSRTYNIKYEGPNGWFDCQKPANQEQVQTNLGLDGGITVYGESLMEAYNVLLNDTWADLEVYYQVSFRGKALISIKVDEDTGDVTVGQTPLGTLETIQVFKSNDDIPNFGSIGLTGGRIE